MLQTRVVIIEERPNPSTDFFILPRFAGKEFDVQRYSFSDLTADASILSDALVVLVRYLPKQWRRLIAQNRPRLKELYFFMDDDVLDIKASKGMPWRYRWKLAKLSALHVGWLKKNQADMWVSTPYLANKYASWKPEMIEPHPVAMQPPSFKIFYHGSSSHQAEVQWLFPVIESVLRQNPNVCFEIIGGRDVYELYRPLERVQVLHPMSWPAYQQFIQQPGRQIGLAPLLKVPFNHARSYTKFFDITRANAVGIYSEDSESGRFVANGEDGVVLPLNQVLWAETILELLDDEQRCLTLTRNAQQRLKAL